MEAEGRRTVVAAARRGRARRLPDDPRSTAGRCGVGGGVEEADGVRPPPAAAAAERRDGVNWVVSAPVDPEGQPAVSARAAAVASEVDGDSWRRVAAGGKVDESVEELVAVVVQQEERVGALEVLASDEASALAVLGPEAGWCERCASGRCLVLQAAAAVRRVGVDRLVKAPADRGARASVPHLPQERSGRRSFGGGELRPAAVLTRASRVPLPALLVWKSVLAPSRCLCLTRPPRRQAWRRRRARPVLRLEGGRCESDTSPEQGEVVRLTRGSPRAELPDAAGGDALPSPEALPSWRRTPTRSAAHAAERRP